MIKKLTLIFAVALGLCAACNNAPEDMVIDIDLQSKGASVPKSMYGVFFEEINHAGDGGLYGEMLMNRSFEERVLPKGYTVEDGQLLPPKVHNHVVGKPTQGKFRWGNDPHPGWSLVKGGKAEATVEITTTSPANQSAPTNMVVNVTNSADSIVSLVNDGYWGIALKRDENYKLRIIARTPAGYKGDIDVRLVGSDGVVLAQKSIPTVNDGAWHDYKEVLTASGTSSEAKLYIDMKGNGKFAFDYVSLFPEKTFKGRENGMREDVAQFLADMRPAFVRWPGGCIVEGISLDNRVEWKKTLGDPALRQGQYDTWGYHNTYGFGYKEFLDYCEDTGAEGMYVCNVGLGCQGRSGDACTDKEAEGFLADALDAIEYAIGDVSTKWGAVRAAEGHPAPYPLTYVEIGNENWGDLYNKRFDMFYKAIKAKYPQLTLISNHGLGDGVKGVEKADMIDPHWYVAPDFFFENEGIFDKYPREGYTVYVGEYACNQGVGGGNMLAALSEAAFISGMERNSDLVTMTSYAPLLENRNDRGWPTNLIWLDNDEVLGRSSYYVQKMYAENMPSYNLNTYFSKITVPERTFVGSGYIGLGSWTTEVEYKDMKVTKKDGTVVTADMSDPSQWNVIKGTWAAKDGSYIQSGNEGLTSLIWNKEKFDDCTIELKARKIGGGEGFFVYFGLEELNMNKGMSVNIGGWGNTGTAFEAISTGSTRTVSDKVGEKIDTDRWYDIKIVVTNMKAEYFIDGKNMLACESRPAKRNFAISGYDETSNEIIIKVVNAQPRKVNATINLKGGKVMSDGKVITLSAQSETDENSFDEPRKIYPNETNYRGFKESFKYSFEPNSFTILRLKKQ